MLYYFRWNRQWTALVVWYIGYSVFALFCGLVFLSCSILIPIAVTPGISGFLIVLGTLLWCCYLHFAFLKSFAACDDETRKAYAGRLWTSPVAMLAVRYYSGGQWLRLALWYVAYSVCVAALFGLLGLSGLSMSHGSDHSLRGWIGRLVPVLWLFILPILIVTRHVRSVFAAPEPKAEEGDAQSNWLDAADPSDAAILAECSWSSFDDAEDTTMTSVHWVEHDGLYEPYPSRDVWLRLEPPARAYWNADGTHHILNERGHVMTSSRWPFVLRSKLPSGCSPATFTTDALAPGGEDGQTVADETAWSRESYSFYLDTVDLLKRTTLRQNFEVREWIVAHPRNGRILRSEERQYDLVTGKLVSRVVRDGYEYNSPAPSHVFRMPWWKPVRLIGETSNDKALRPDPNTRQAIESVIALSDAAWKDGDFGGFAAVWDFSVMEEHIPKERWRTAVRKQEGLWSAWHSSVIDIQSSKHVGIPLSANSFQLVSVPQGALQVTVEVNAVWTDGEIWTGRTLFVLTPVNAGLKIVFWNVPIDEIRVRHDRRL